MDDRNFDVETANEWIEMVEGVQSQVRESDLFPLLKEWQRVSNPSQILDIGCGQGVCSGKLDLSSCDYTGVDPSKFLLDRARKNFGGANRSFVEGSAYALPFSPKSFDAAFSIAVWHLLEDKKLASKELSRVLKDNGQFMIVAANPEKYDDWIKNYKEVKRDGPRLEGVVQKDDGTSSIDVLYLHTYDEIVGCLRDAGLDITGTITFRTAIAINGQKLQ